MSKIGKISISIPDKVKVVLNGNILNIEGPLGKKSLDMNLEIFDLNINDGKEVSIKPKIINQNTKRLWGMNRSLVNNAIDGTLLIMVGGSLQDFPKIEEILKCMGSDVVYCGTIGSGSKMKLINNYMSIVSNIVTAETLSLVHKSGIDQKLAIELMSTTAAGKGHMNFSYPKKVLINDVGPGFKNVLALKDLRLAIEHGESEGIELTSGKSVLNIYEKAMDTKYKDLDWTAMFNFVKESNNLD